MDRLRTMKITILLCRARLEAEARGLKWRFGVLEMKESSLFIFWLDIPLVLFQLMFHQTENVSEKTRKFKNSW